jgi:hypothetical protein
MGTCPGTALIVHLWNLPGKHGLPDNGIRADLIWMTALIGS